MSGERYGKIGIFGVGPSSIAAIERFGPSATVFQKSGTVFPPRSTYTLKRGYEPHFDQFVPQEMLLPMSEMRILTSGVADFTVKTGNGYFMVDVPGVMGEWRKRARQTGAHIETLPRNLKPEDIRVKERDGGVIVSIEGGDYEFDNVIDATGTRALLASQVEPQRRDENFLAAYVYGGTFHGRVYDGQMALVFGPAGGTSWVSPSIYQDETGEPLIDVAFSGWGHRSHFDHFRKGDGRERLNQLVKFVQRYPDIEIDSTPVDVYSGISRSQKASVPQSGTVFAVGEAGGFAKPCTGESFNRALESGQIAVDVIVAGGTPADLHKKFYNRHRGDNLLLSFSLNRLADQSVGNVGYLMDQMAWWWYSDKVNREKFVKRMEKFLMEGKYPPLLFLRLLSDSQFTRMLISGAKTLADIKFRPERITPTDYYPFPPLYPTETAETIFPIAS